jgi:hypothetical protein
VLLALGVFLSRALIPVGFMPTVGTDGRASLGMCPSYGAAPAAASSHGALAHAHHDHGARGDGGAADRHGSCVFAASAHAAPAPVQLLKFTAALTASRLHDVDSQLAAPLGSVPRAQSARAPPTLI